MEPTTATRILVVDGEPTLRSVISGALTNDGHEILEAASAEEALRLFREQPFPLVISDNVTSGATGLDLIQQVGVSHPDTLFIITTSHASLESAVSAIRSGAYDYLIKPFEDPNVVSASVARAVEVIRLREENIALVKRLRRARRPRRLPTG